MLGPYFNAPIVCRGWQHWCTLRVYQDIEMNNTCNFSTLFEHVSIEHVEKLDLRNYIGAVDLGVLRKMKALKKLFFNESYKYTDELAETLLPLNSLEELDLGEFGGLTDGGAKSLSKLNLRKLIANNCIQITDEGFRFLCNSQLEDLSVSDCNVTDEGLRSLDGNDRMRSLRLSYCNVTRDGLLAISKSKSLVSLDLECCNVGNDGTLEIIGKMKGLEKLSIGFSRSVTDANVIFLEGLQNLRSLDIRTCDISDEGLKTVSKLVTLEELFLAGCERVTDVGLGLLNNLRNIQALSISSCAITDNGVYMLAKTMPKLEWLSLKRCKVTNTSMNTLSELEKLRVLKITDCDVNGDGLEMLRKSKSLRKVFANKKTLRGFAMSTFDVEIDMD